MSSMVPEYLIGQIEPEFLRGDDPALTQPDRIELIAIERSRALFDLLAQ